MNIADLGFTDVQTVAIFELMQNLHKCNTDLMSNCRVKGVTTYFDNRKNFVCSYYLQSLGDGDGVQGEIKYVEIQPDGSKQDLMEVYRSEMEVMRRIDRMEKFNF